MSNPKTYEQYLAENGSLTYTFKGVSMKPMLTQGRDLFTVAAKGPQRCKKYDVVLYRRPPNQYVLHRIIQVRQEDYVILGDNCIGKEYGIRDEDIIGVLTAFTFCGRHIPVSDWRYQLYCHVWVWLHPLRITVKKAGGKLKRLAKRILRNEA